MRKALLCCLLLAPAVLPFRDASSRPAWKAHAQQPHGWSEPLREQLRAHLYESFVQQFARVMTPVRREQFVRLSGCIVRKITDVYSPADFSHLTTVETAALCNRLLTACCAELGIEPGPDTLAL